MKKWNLYKIRDEALANKQAVFSIQQLANLLSKPKSVAKVYASRLVKSNLAKRIQRGKLSFSDDEYVIASQLLQPSYVSFHSALLLHGLSQQIPKYIECANTKNSRVYENLGITYHKLPPKFFYGYKKVSKSSSYMLLAEPEKALLDGLYLGIFSKKDAQELKPSLDMKRLSSLLAQYGGRGRKKLEKMVK